MAKKLARHGRHWFAFHLCRTVPNRFDGDVDALLRSMPAPLFERWYTLYQLEPWGEERSDRATGELIAYLMACHGAQPRLPDEYMPYLRRLLPPEEEQPEADMRRAVQAISAQRKRMEQ